ncbi:endo alpha-1,4 polygalactosaminidase [Thalassospira marina]|uniref:Glycoside-hydrolase family GH114 TIM-barrel domain-containing protein n=1 Tax=Thalassospira marina TaxID=2048283 RepID=A0A2N3KCW0_9PROT|nr:endo alpha-1,4 polygalactosaminidase [Thalassospira marina]PKR48417.1 hypothetical protein COO20_24435 [Thalassospira marina]
MHQFPYRLIGKPGSVIARLRGIALLAGILASCVGVLPAFATGIDVGGIGHKSAQKQAFEMQKDKPSDASLMMVAASAQGNVNAKPVRVPDARFFLQLQGDVTAPAGTRVIDADLFDVDSAQVAEWRDAGIYTICYMSAGSYEDWRPDAGQYPKSVLGNDYEGWPGEKWLDIRQIARLAPIIKARLDLCREKGFRGVDPDNIDGYLTKTGFNLSRDDALRFVRWMASEAHKRGLTIGQKNAPDMVRDLAGVLDFAITESPVTFDHAHYFAPYVAQHKPVFAIEYLTDDGAIRDFCRQMVERGFQGINASQALDGSNYYCNE